MITIGNTIVQTIFELDASEAMRDVVKVATPDKVKQIPWLIPDYADEQGAIKALNQSFLVRTPDTTVIIDTCVGNGRPRPEMPAWSGLDTPYLENLKAAVNPSDVDYVICTHLHFDHVGWNTVEQDGSWLPLFPNAKYVIDREEFDYWTARPEAELIDDHNGVDESVRPLAEKGLIRLAGPGEQLTPEIRLVPLPGHTPHHIGALISSEGQSALFTGDVFHHPCQIARPDWTSFDTDETTALATRRRVLEQYADTDTVIIGAHFSEPVGGRIVRDDDGYRLMS